MDGEKWTWQQTPRNKMFSWHILGMFTVNKNNADTALVYEQAHAGNTGISRTGG